MSTHNLNRRTSFSSWASILIGLTATYHLTAQIQCGGEGQRVCTSGDSDYSIYYNQAPYNKNHPLQLYPPFYFTNNACDLALGVDSKTATCQNTTSGKEPAQGGLRHQLNHNANPPGSWIEFAMEQQRGPIQSDQAMNWITILGTHNSFSNYQDGAFDVLNPFTFKPLLNMNVDQQFSLSDQLDAGARMVRLDPVSYPVLHDDYRDSDNELRMCHQSGSGTETELECNFTSYGRLFAYGVAEVSAWLTQNPYAVLVIRLNRVQPQDLIGIDNVLYEELESKGNHLLRPTGTATPWNPATMGWPTMRQMREMGTRAIVFSSLGPSLYTFAWSSNGPNLPGWVINDGYTDSTGFGGCLNTPTSATANDAIDVRSRAYNTWSYIGEDRSGSNYFNIGSEIPSAVGGAGLLDAASVTHAANCGFGLINIDFLLALDRAAHFDQTFSFHLEIPDHFDESYTFHAFDYRCTTGWDPTNCSNSGQPDLRREAAIWSWDENDFGDQGPAILKGSGRWGSAVANSVLPFACAMSPGDPLKPALYDWFITKERGTWDQGVAACYKAGATFWSPQSALENMRLAAAANGSPVWINYQASRALILEPISSQLTYGSEPDTFEITVHQGDPDWSLSPAFQFTAGTGGALQVSTDPDGPLFNSIASNSLGKDIHLSVANSAHDPSGAITLKPGQYFQTFTVSETSGISGKQFTIVVNVLPARVNIAINSVPSGVSFEVDGQSYRTNTSFSWQQGSTHSVALSTVNTIDPTRRAVFAQWSDGDTNPSRTIVADKDAAYTGLYTTQYLLTVDATPATGGTVTGAGWYDAGSKATLTAAAANGFEFDGFANTSQAGGEGGSPLTLAVNDPIIETAIFANHPPHLNVVMQVLDDGSNSLVSIGATLLNSGAGLAEAAEIDSIDFQTLAGTGAVALSTALPASFGAIAAGSQSPENGLLFNWPSTATRVKMTVHFSANYKGYQSSQALYLFR